MFRLAILDTDISPFMPARNKYAAGKRKKGYTSSFHLNKFRMMKQLPWQFNALWKKLEVWVEEES
jgi:hypothetical protein